MDWFFGRLFDTLQILLSFFHASGKGLSIAVMENQLYGVSKQTSDVNVMLDSDWSQVQIYLSYFRVNNSIMIFLYSCTIINII